MITLHNPEQKYEFALWKNWPGLCWRCITKLSVCHGSERSAFKETRSMLWLIQAANTPTATVWCWSLLNLTPFPRGPQVTKIPKVPSRPLQTVHLTALSAARRVSLDPKPSMAFNWKLKGYKLHPCCSQRALGSAQAAWAMLCVSQQMPPWKKKTQTFIQTSLYTVSQPAGNETAWGYCEHWSIRLTLIWTNGNKSVCTYQKQCSFTSQFS